MSSSRKIVGVILPVLFGVVTVRVRAAAGPDLPPDQLLSKAVEATNWTRNMHLRLDFRTRPIGWAKGDFGPSAILEQSGTGEIFVSGDRLRTIRQNAAANGFDGAHVETLVTPERRIMWVKNGSVQYTESKSVIEHAASLDRGSRLMGWFLDGVFSDQIYHPFTFSTAVQVGKVQQDAVEQNVGGISCRVVDVVGDSWELRVWVAPSRSYNFARYTFDSKADPKTKRAEFHCDVDQIQYQQLADGTWVIRSGRFLNTAPDSHGHERGDETTVNRTFIDVSPDFEKLKAFDVPPILNGEPVFRTEAAENGRETESDSGVQYMWKDGKIVPAYDPALVERIRKQMKQDATTKPGAH